MWQLLLQLSMLAMVLGSAPYQRNEESLQSALNAVTRKQRSMESSPQDYYNDLRSFKYHGPELDRKFDRERQNERELEDADEIIEFIPSDGGQLETVGDGIQNINSKLLENAFMDYLENVPDQDEPTPSLFRERERLSGHKRAEDKKLAKLFLSKLQGDGAYGQPEPDEDDYMDIQQMLLDRYRNDRDNKQYESEGPMSWSELFNSRQALRGRNREDEPLEYGDRDQEQEILYLLPTERRNVNGRYPIGRDYRNLHTSMKRFPVAKRSPKPMPVKRQPIDPKVAHDLGALFGTQLADNKTATDHTESPKTTRPPKGEKEKPMKPAKSKGKAKPIEVKKKSIDWSQYFGIDRRKKKAPLMARPGTKAQDDEWLLQRYYQTMADNLKPPMYEQDRTDEEDAYQEKPRWSDINDLLAKEAIKYNNLKHEMNEDTRFKHVFNNLTSYFRENNIKNRVNDKRNNKKISHEDIEEPLMCPQMQIIKESCMADSEEIDDELIGRKAHLLYDLCVMLQLCKTCTTDETDDRCYNVYALGSRRVCDNVSNRKDSETTKMMCYNAALILSEIKIPHKDCKSKDTNYEKCMNTCLLLHTIDKLILPSKFRIDTEIQNDSSQSTKR